MNDIPLNPDAWIPDTLLERLDPNFSANPNNFYAQYLLLRSKLSAIIGEILGEYALFAFGAFLR